MSAVLKDQFAILDARDGHFAEPGPTRCVYCNKRCEPNIQTNYPVPVYSDQAEFCCEACDSSKTSRENVDADLGDMERKGAIEDALIVGGAA